jgi:hypothetical protein
VLPPDVVRDGLGHDPGTAHHDAASDGSLFFRDRGHNLIDFVHLFEPYLNGLPGGQRNFLANIIGGDG